METCINSHFAKIQLKVGLNLDGTWLMRMSLENYTTSIIKDMILHELGKVLALFNVWNPTGWAFKKVFKWQD